MRTPLYKLIRVCFFHRFGLKTDIVFDHFDLKSDIVFKGTTSDGVYKGIPHFIIKRKRIEREATKKYYSI